MAKQRGLSRPPAVGTREWLMWGLPALLLLAFGIYNAEAYVRRLPFLVRLILPRSSIDFAADIPRDPVELLATPMSVIFRREVHPALRYQLLQAMSATHRGGGILHQGGESHRRMRVIFHFRTSHGAISKKVCRSCNGISRSGSPTGSNALGC